MRYGLGSDTAMLNISDNVYKRMIRVDTRDRSGKSCSRCFRDLSLNISFRGTIGSQWLERSHAHARNLSIQSNAS